MHIALYEKIKSANSLFEIYNRVFENIGKGCKPLIKEKGDFDKIFVDKSFFNTSIDTFLKEKKEQYDFINVMNLLHLLPPPSIENLIGRIRESLNENGIIFIRVEPRLFFSPNLFKSAVDKNFSSGEHIDYYKNNIWSHSTFLNVNI
ncbi:MAG: hypothetical protein R3B93_20115 [Bacteroidia bacterium]